MGHFAREVSSLASAPSAGSESNQNRSPVSVRLRQIELTAGTLSGRRARLPHKETCGKNIAADALGSLQAGAVVLNQYRAEYGTHRTR